MEYYRSSSAVVWLASVFRGRGFSQSNFGEAAQCARFPGLRAFLSLASQNPFLFLQNMWYLSSQDLTMTLPLEPDLLRQLLDAQTAISTADPDLAVVMDLAARHSQQLTGAEGAVVELTEGDDMVYRAVSGMARASMGLRIHRRGSFSGLCVERGQALICQDSETDDRVDREACRRVGLRSMVVQPLFHREVAVGVIKVMSPAPGGFQGDTVEILGHLGPESK